MVVPEGSGQDGFGPPVIPFEVAVAPARTKAFVATRCGLTTPPNGVSHPYPRPMEVLGTPDVRCRNETKVVSPLVDRPGQTRREAGTQSQGSQRGDRPAADPGASSSLFGEGEPVKANLARFTWAIMLLGSMALTIGAGIRWD